MRRWKRLLVCGVLGVLMCGCDLSVEMPAKDKKSRAIPTTSAPQSEEFFHVEMGSLLPVGTASVELYEFGTSEEIRGLVEKMQASIRENKAEYEKHERKNAGRKGRLPYHSSMGITAEEYKKIGDAKPVLVKAGSVPLSVERTDTAIVLRGSEALKSLDGLSIELADRRLKTPLLDCGTPENVRERELPSFGTWEGYSWKSSIQEEDDPASDCSISVEFSVGRLRGGDKGFIRYDVIKTAKRTLISRESEILVYNLSGSASPTPTP